VKYAIYVSRNEEVTGPFTKRELRASGDSSAIDNGGFENPRLMAASPGTVFESADRCEPATDAGKR